MWNSWLLMCLSGRGVNSIGHRVRAFRSIGLLYFSPGFIVTVNAGAASVVDEWRPLG